MLNNSDTVRWQSYIPASMYKLYTYYKMSYITVEKLIVAACSRGTILLHVVYPLMSCCHVIRVTSMSEKSESWKSSTLTVVSAEYEVAGKRRERESDIVLLSVYQGHWYVEPSIKVTSSQDALKSNYIAVLKTRKWDYKKNTFLVRRPLFKEFLSSTY